MVDLHWIVLLPVLMGILLIVIPMRLAKTIVVFFQLFMVLANTANFIHVKNEGTWLMYLGGWPEHIGIALRADALASVMVLVTSLLFLALFIFNMKKSFTDNMFLFLFLSLSGLMMGIFLSNDLFNIFVLVEVATVIISILIMYKRDARSIYDGMLYLLVNVVAMMFFLLGVGMVYKRLGVLDLTGIAAQVALLDGPSGLLLPYGLLITAVSLKSALMPLFSWLPKAHGTPSAPSIVSALLSGLYVKSGIYLFIRLQEAFSAQIQTGAFFLYMGLITAVIGFLLAVVQTDIKLILAYSTVSQIGFIMMAINIGDPQAYWGGLYHMMNHAIFKTTLFLAAGLIVDRYGTRNIHEINGVFQRMPQVAVVSVLAILGIIGAPLFNGSISKYLVAYGMIEIIGESGMFFVNLGTVMVFLRFSEIFLGRWNGKKEKEDMYSLTVVTVLGIMCLIGGLFGRELIGILFDVRVIVDPISYMGKAVLFLITIISGFGFYVVYIRRVKIAGILRSHELTFNGVCTTIVLFFVTIMTYLRLTH